MLLKITITTIGLLSLAAPVYAKFVPEPTPPPVITQSSGTRRVATIPIPNPPQSRSVATQTRQQCYQQIHNMRIARNRAGWDREASARLWVRQVEQCNRIPAVAPIEGRPGRNA